MDIQTNTATSSLHIASQNGHVEIVNELLSNGANLNFKPTQEQLPTYCQSKWNVEAVQELLSKFKT